MKCALHLQCYFHIAQQLNRNYSDFNGELDKAQIRVRLIQAIIEGCDFHIRSESADAHCSRWSGLGCLEVCALCLDERLGEPPLTPAG